MSRDIKFRAWDETNKRIVHFELGDLDGGLYLDDDKSFSVKEVMQFTGLKDRTGVEIYEGDIVNYGIGYKGANQRQQAGVVVWESAGAYFRIKDSSSDTGNSWSAYLDELWCEVIGNVYENKDLLV